MASILRFRNVTSHPEQHFGIHRLNLTLNRGGRYLIDEIDAEIVKNFLLLLEHESSLHGGIIESNEKTFKQFDHQLLGEKIISETVEHYLALKNSFFNFEGRKRSKAAFLDKLQMKRLKSMAVYKLLQSERIRFCLLALLFQQKGLLVIRDLIKYELSESELDVLKRLIQHSPCCLIIISTEFSEISEKFDVSSNDFQQIDLKKHDRK